MSGRVQGAPRAGWHPGTKALIVFVAGFLGMGVTIGAARVLVAAATWAYTVAGWWMFLPVALVVGWVGAVEARRWAR